MGLPEKEVRWRTKTNKGKFPAGTEHIKIIDPYDNVGYKGIIHIRPGKKAKAHIDY